MGLAQLTGKINQEGAELVVVLPLQSTWVIVTFANVSGKNQYVPAERSTFMIDPARLSVDPVIVIVCVPPPGGGQARLPLSLTEPVKTAPWPDHCAPVHEDVVRSAFTMALADSLIVQLKPSVPVPEPLPDKLY